jgi:hypothetical protein
MRAENSQAQCNSNQLNSQQRSDALVSFLFHTQNYSIPEEDLLLWLRISFVKQKKRWRGKVLVSKADEIYIHDVHTQEYTLLRKESHHSATQLKNGNILLVFSSFTESYIQELNFVTGSVYYKIYVDSSVINITELSDGQNVLIGCSRKLIILNRKTGSTIQHWLNYPFAFELDDGRIAMSTEELDPCIIVLDEKAQDVAQKYSVEEVCEKFPIVPSIENNFKLHVLILFSTKRAMICVRGATGKDISTLKLSDGKIVTEEIIYPLYSSNTIRSVYVCENDKLKCTLPESVDLHVMLQIDKDAIVSLEAKSYHERDKLIVCDINTGQKINQYQFKKCKFLCFIEE